MAKTPKASDAARVKAREMREAQARKDKQVKLVIIGVVTALVLAIVVSVSVVVWNQVREDQAANSVNPTEVFGEHAEGGPIVYSHLGVGKADPALPTLVEYFDYSCHVCADVDVIAGEQLTKGATDGKYNIEFRPVVTVNMPFHQVGTSASFIIARESPENWAKFHHSMMSYFQSEYNAGKGDVTQNPRNSRNKIKEIALQAGVPANVADKIPGATVAENYLKKATDAWGKAPVQGRQIGQDGQPRVGTPEFVVNGQVRPLPDYRSATPEQVYTAIVGDLAAKK